MLGVEFVMLLSKLAGAIGELLYLASGLMVTVEHGFDQGKGLARGIDSSTTLLGGLHSDPARSAYRLEPAMRGIGWKEGPTFRVDACTVSDAQGADQRIAAEP